MGIAYARPEPPAFGRRIMAHPRDLPRFSPAEEQQIAEALRRLNAGDRDAVEVLYTFWVGPVRGLAHQFVGSIVRQADEVEDVVQEVFVEFVRLAAAGRIEAEDAPGLWR